MFSVEKIPSLCFLYGNFIFYIFYGRNSFEIFSAESVGGTLVERSIFVKGQKIFELSSNDRRSEFHRQRSLKLSSQQGRPVIYKKKSSSERNFFKVSVKKSFFQVSIKRRIFKVFDREKNFKRSAVGRHFKRILK